MTELIDDPRRRQLTRLGPVEQLRAGRMPRRLAQLMLGLLLYGLTLAMLIRATLGNAPWDVLHQGMAIHLPMSIGTAVIVMSLLVLLLWIPIKEIPGFGTVCNAVLIGLWVDVFLAHMSAPDALGWRLVLVALGVAGNAVATSMYLGAQLGSGPRDGLMTGFHRVTGVSIGLVRGILEVSVVVIGWLLGGVFGVGTIAYALLIGPLVQWTLPYFIVELPRVRSRVGPPA